MNAPSLELRMPLGFESRLICNHCRPRRHLATIPWSLGGRARAEVVMLEHVEAAHPGAWARFDRAQQRLINAEVPR